MSVLDQLVGRIKEKGIKVSHQRLEILREILGSKEHPDVKTIHVNLKQRIPTISLDTVYRTLWLLLENDLIGTVGFPFERVRFDGNMKPHHHFICKVCGTIYDIHDENLDSLPIPDSVKRIGVVTEAQVEIRGTCKKCNSKI